MSKTLDRTRCYIGFEDEKGFVNPWNTYAAVGELQSAVCRLLLPDVSTLPFAAIAEIRDRSKDVLNPMRAELLRLTEDLRKLVGEKATDPAIIKVEAENLVATRVEPVVREAAQRTKELAEKKWRKLYTSAATAFGFAGASFIDPKLIGKAIQHTLETGALMFKDEEDNNRHPKMTAQFVLQAHNVLRGK